jgi:hypothetical protein
MCSAVVAGSLTACSGSGTGTPNATPLGASESRVRALDNTAISLAPPWNPSGEVRRLQFNTPRVSKAETPPLQRGGYYGAEFSGTDILGWAPKPNKNNDPPICNIPSGTGFNGITSDRKGHLVVPGVFEGVPEINLYSGPPVCGTLLATIPDSTGQPGDAGVVFNAAQGNFVVGEIANYTSHAGDVLVCSFVTLSCGAPVTNSNITGYGAGVAMAANGDCWMAAGTSEFDLVHPGFVLVYWQGCTGPGQVATGTLNASYGGLFIDRNGYLGSFDAFSNTLYVYSGCNPACTLVGGPFQLKGQSFFGNLNGAGTRLAVGDYSNADIDVYSYTPTGLTFKYSFNAGLVPNDIVESGIFEPQNPQP